ncbi:helix-turn-helix domain-containing protein [Fusobacterium ulcerans]|uniref:LexA family transcriptional regulator n=1 Tax=Fusobacterium ulcerans TaxID=861 RepID=UPI000E53C8D1|nr:XRE family transcriptional regulator [Fusobacterium ulcerans]RGY66705.1 helix-turn-helix domain-containing protein [Fusobacterium ulcerans]
MDKKFSKFLEEFLRKNDFTLDYVAEMTKSSFSSIGHYKRGTRIPSEEFIEKFLKAFNFTENEKKEIRYIASVDRSPKLIKEILNKKEDEPIVLENNIIEMMEIPFFSSASAGFGYITEEEPENYIEVPKMEGDIIGVKVSGDSMEKTLYDGDIALIDRNKDVNIGDVGVFITNKETGEAVIKRLAYKNGRYILESDNVYYRKITINSNDVKVCGKVVKILKGNTKKRRDPFLELFNSLDANSQRELLEYADYLKTKPKNKKN